MLLSCQSRNAVTVQALEAIVEVFGELRIDHVFLLSEPHDAELWVRAEVGLRSTYVNQETKERADCYYAAATTGLLTLETGSRVGHWKLGPPLWDMEAPERLTECSQTRPALDTVPERTAEARRGDAYRLLCDSYDAIVVRDLVKNSCSPRKVAVEFAKAGCLPESVDVARVEERDCGIPGAPGALAATIPRGASCHPEFKPYEHSSGLQGGSDPVR